MVDNTVVVGDVDVVVASDTIAVPVTLVVADIVLSVTVVVV